MLFFIRCGGSRISVTFILNLPIFNPFLSEGQLKTITLKIPTVKKSTVATIELIHDTVTCKPYQSRYLCLNLNLNLLSPTACAYAVDRRTDTQTQTCRLKQINTNT